MNFLMVFDFTQFWLDGRPGNEYFWISHKISGLLTPLTPLGVHPQLFKTTVWNRYERFLLLWYGCTEQVFWHNKIQKQKSFTKWINYLTELVFSKNVCMCISRNKNDPSESNSNHCGTHSGWCIAFVQNDDN